MGIYLNRRRSHFFKEVELCFTITVFFCKAAWNHDLIVFEMLNKLSTAFELRLNICRLLDDRTRSQLKLNTARMQNADDTVVGLACLFVRMLHDEAEVCAHINYTINNPRTHARCVGVGGPPSSFI